MRVSDSAQISGVFIIAGVGENCKTEKSVFDILDEETKNGNRVWYIYTKSKKWIDKKLCVCYACNTAKLQSEYLLMSLEKGVAVKEAGTSFYLQRRGNAAGTAVQKRLSKQGKG